MKILVTGGGGFLGSAVCRQLAGLGHDVIAYQRSPADHLRTMAWFPGKAASPTIQNS